MRMPWIAASRFVLCVTACAACGGSQAASGGPKSAETNAGADGPPAAAPPSEPPTTTAALGDRAQPSGTKLAESEPSAATGNPAPAAAGTSAAASGGGRAHEPGRSAADIRAIIVAHREEARACYDKALADHPGIEGDLVVDWTIDPKGSVSKIFLDTARSQITAPEVGACVVAIIQKLQFASSPGGYETRTSYPFNFHPRRTSTNSAQ